VLLFIILLGVDKMPKISVIIPAYNVEKHIEKTLKSLINQTFYDFEAIIINDGSTDNTEKIIKDVLQDTNFQWKLINQENQGVSAARNRGIIESKGEYICFLDADDYYHQDLIREIGNLLNNAVVPADIIYWGWDKVDENKRLIDNYEKKYKYIIKSDSFLIEYMTGNIWIWTGSAAYRKKFLIENHIFFPEKIAIAEDIVFIFTALLKAKTIKCIPKSLSFYCIHADSISQKYTFKSIHTIKAMYLLEQLLEDGIQEKEIFLSKFKPQFYWNMINGLLLFDKNDYETKKKIIRLIKNESVRKVLKKQKYEKTKSKIRKFLIIYFPKFYIDFIMKLRNRG